LLLLLRLQQQQQVCEMSNCEIVLALKWLFATCGAAAGALFVVCFGNKYNILCFSWIMNFAKTQKVLPSQSQQPLAMFQTTRCIRAMSLACSNFVVYLQHYQFHISKRQTLQFYV